MAINILPTIKVKTNELSVRSDNPRKMSDTEFNNLVYNDCKIKGYDINIVMKDLIINYKLEKKNEGSDESSKTVT
jgi:hypothetical protein